MKGGLVHETNPGTSTVCGSSYVEKSILEEGERYCLVNPLQPTLLKETKP